MKVEILFENQNCLVLNKPAGLIVHPTQTSGFGKGGNEDLSAQTETLVHWVIKNYPEMEKIGEPLVLTNSNLESETINRAGIVHRLDKETSGVIVLAKNQKAYLHLKKQFQERRIQKKYKAFAYGLLKNDKGLISRPIGRSPKFGLWSATKGIRGKVREAVTKYIVLKRGVSQTFLEIYPQTGRTHQIRVHLKAINHPIVCDKLYAPKKACALGFKRLALHAESLEFEDLGGEIIRVKAPLPDDFIEAQKNL